MVEALGREPLLKQTSRRSSQACNTCVWARLKPPTISGNTPLGVAVGGHHARLHDAGCADPAQLSNL